MILSDFVLVGAVYYFLKNTKYTQQVKFILFSIVVLNPGLLLVDRILTLILLFNSLNEWKDIHFQYNGMLLGLLILSLAFLRQVV